MVLETSAHFSRVVCVCSLQRNVCANVCSPDCRACARRAVAPFQLYAPTKGRPCTAFSGSRTPFRTPRRTPSSGASPSSGGNRRHAHHHHHAHHDRHGRARGIRVHRRRVRRVAPPKRNAPCRRGHRRRCRTNRRRRTVRRHRRRTSPDRRRDQNRRRRRNLRPQRAQSRPQSAPSGAQCPSGGSPPPTRRRSSCCALLRAPHAHALPLRGEEQRARASRAGKPPPGTESNRALQPPHSQARPAPRVQEKLPPAPPARIQRLRTPMLRVPPPGDRRVATFHQRIRALLGRAPQHRGGLPPMPLPKPPAPSLPPVLQLLCRRPQAGEEDHTLPAAGSLGRAGRVTSWHSLRHANQISPI